MVILSVLIGAGGVRKWSSFTRYDSAGRTIWQANPSVVSGYDEQYDDLLNYNSSTSKYQYLKDSDGLISISQYGTSGGATENYVTARFIRKGQTGSDIQQGSTTYVSQTAGSETRLFVSKQVHYTSDTNPALTI